MEVLIVFLVLVICLPIIRFLIIIGIGIRFMLKLYTFLSKNVYSWRSYGEIKTVSYSPRWLRDAVLEAMIEDGDLLHKPTDAAVTVSSRLVEGKFVSLSDEEGGGIRPELVQLYENPEMFKTMPKHHFEYRLNPQRPRRGRGRNKLRISGWLPQPAFPKQRE